MSSLGFQHVKVFDVILSQAFFSFCLVGSDVVLLCANSSRLFEGLLRGWLGVKPKIQDGKQNDGADDIKGLFLLHPNDYSSGLTPSFTSSTKILAGLKDGI